MEHHTILFGAIFAGVFLLVSTLLQMLSKRFTSVPYTVALLISGFLAQQIFHFFDFHFVPSLSTDVIYYILLPLLLFESAYHVNIHQFKLQFKTITFMATFGLLVSVFVVAAFLFYTTGVPFGVALLFGAIISATDPIAVIALFKTLGGPKRLGLLADGESMFNDATGVIVFKIVAAIVVGQQAVEGASLIGKGGTFLYVFVGSMIFGALAGMLATKIFGSFKRDRLALATLMIAVSVLSFNVSEHFFGLSGVISTVVTALVLGNFGIPKITSRSLHFIDEMWEAVAFYSISLIFFFSTFNLHLGIFTEINPMWIAMAVISVLIARSVSVYLSCYITNNAPGFRDEPGVPLRWQHILNWGGLRGIIPLVLVYTLAEDYQYRDLMLAFTLATFLFTLLVNGFTIKFLLIKLGLHLPAREEEIIKEETAIFTTEELKNLLATIPEEEFNKDAIAKVREQLDQDLKEHKEKLLSMDIDEETMLRSFKLQVIQIERMTAHELHEQGYINEFVYQDFMAELDLQEDALEYPDIYGKTVDSETGHIKSRKTFRQQISQLDAAIDKYPFLKRFFRKQEKDIIRQRYMLLKTRLIASSDVLWYLDFVSKLVKNKKDVLAGIEKLKMQHKSYEEDNRKQLNSIGTQYKKLIEEYEHKVINHLLYRREIHNHMVL